MTSCVALIPARSGSKRVKDKNVRLLDVHPLLAYSIESAKESGVFRDVYVSTNDHETGEIAQKYGLEGNVMIRPPEFATSTSPDIEWVTHALGLLGDWGKSADCFAILRPTSPFRTADTIRRAWEQWTQPDRIHPFDSLRAVELVSQHPGKMWLALNGSLEPMQPLMSQTTHHPNHSSPYQSLPTVYIQNASLEIAWTKTVREKGTIAGECVMPFFTKGYEGFDINVELDFKVAEWLIQDGLVKKPTSLVTPLPAAYEAAFLGD